MFFKEIQIKLMNPAFLLLYISEGSEVSTQKKYKGTHVYSASITLAKMQPKCLTTDT
jgi:hypothetical protein